MLTGLRRPAARRLVVIAGSTLVYAVGVAVALGLGWHPSALPGYLYLGVVTALGAAAADRWPLETLTNVTAFTAYTTLAPLPPALFGLYVGPPEALVPLAVVTFVVVSGRGPVIAPSATFASLAVLVVVPWRDIVGTLVERRPLGEALLIDTGVDRSILFAELVACALVVLVAVMLRRQRHATAVLAEQNRELLELRAGEVARIAERERTRVAREVHDEVAHHVAALVIQAQAALRVADRHPDQLTQAMADIAEGGKNVLGRIRAVVRILEAGPTTVPSSCPPTLATELTALFDRIRAIGYVVHASVSVDDAVPPEHRAVIVGVVQESLTNAMLHSSAQTVRVAVEQQPGTWSVTVADPGPAQERFPGVPRGGSGIPAMRDRLTALGGRLSTASEDGGGWTVRAELPRTDRPARRTRARKRGSAVPA